MLDALPLPRHPNVEQYKKQTKELLKACKSGDPQALPAWVTQWLAVQLGIDPALATARRAYTAGEIAHRIRHGAERVTKHLRRNETRIAFPETVSFRLNRLTSL